MSLGANVDVICALREQLGAEDVQFVNIPITKWPTALANSQLFHSNGFVAKTMATNPAPNSSFVGAQ